MRVKPSVGLFAVPVLVFLSVSVWSGQLHDAARGGDRETVERLIVDGEDVQEIDGETALTPLVEAALAGNKEIVVLLIEKGADPAGRDGKGFTALHAAAHMGHVDIVELLIEQGVDVNDQENTSRITPMHAAAERDYQDVAKVLLLNDVNLNLKTEAGHTPVILAVLNQHADMVKLLRDHGADCTFRSKRFSEYCLNAGN
ncbi:MAG: ankyrin repeat domain-containing protein [Arenicellales bacterium]|nr:ankyrin repeat domain-containing protein [Arenicellales bacterium]